MDYFIESQLAQLIPYSTGRSRIQRVHALISCHLELYHHKIKYRLKLLPIFFIILLPKVPVRDIR